MQMLMQLPLEKQHFNPPFVKGETKTECNKPRRLKIAILINYFNNVVYDDLCIPTATYQLLSVVFPHPFQEIVHKKTALNLISNIPVISSSLWSCRSGMKSSSIATSVLWETASSSSSSAVSGAEGIISKNDQNLNTQM